MSWHPRLSISALKWLNTSHGSSPRLLRLPGRGPADLARRVFVVHGRDESVQRAMFEFLRVLDLKPLDWEELVAETGTATPFLGDVVAGGPTRVQAAIVLYTPDDEVSLHPGLRDPDEADFETKPMMQPRPNVLIELGMALTALPTRTIIVEFGSHELRPVADIAGRNVIKFDGSYTALGKIVERLKGAGCAVADCGPAWLGTDRFEDLTAYTRKPGHP